MSPGGAKTTKPMFLPTKGSCRVPPRLPSYQFDASFSTLLSFSDPRFLYLHALSLAGTSGNLCGKSALSATSGSVKMSGWKSNGDEPTFKWGKRSHTARVAEKPAYFYESFTYDGIEYFLYDSVYLHAVNEPEPYIAKLLKAWEYGDPATKKIKVLWFFRPVELKNWLGNHQPEKNELFLASGKGVGLANINPLGCNRASCFSLPPPGLSMVEFVGDIMGARFPREELRTCAFDDTWSL